MDTNLNNFKHVLEYFVAHLNYVQSNYSESAKGYDQYIKPYKEGNLEFCSSGQGWKNNNIQNQIKKWESVNERKICINVQANFGDFTSRKCYLNWESTGINILCEWDKVHNEVANLSIGYGYWWCEPTQYEILMTKSVDEMNLFKEDADISGIEEFYNKFTQEIIDYEEKKSQYYTKEKEYYDEQEKKNITKNCESYLNLLKSNHNLILTGAPGTGKTYLAKQIAQIMIFGEPKEEMSEEEKKQFNEQCSFVQFHPSYDYTDFVEGLRPTQDDGGNVGFKPKDGVFKEFCLKALQNFVNSRKQQDTLTSEESFKNKYNEVIDKINNGEITEFDLKMPGKKMEIVEISNRNNIILRTPGTTGKYTVSFKRIAALAKVYKDEDSLGKMTTGSIVEQIKGCNASAYRAVLNKVYSQSNSGAPQQEIKEKPFIFVIDEINRGEISKIFGELFFSIDPGYRGINGAVRTQYANMQTDEPNDFDDALSITDSENFGHFFVPKNVYIIGTMNDIDRSVESMDFAFRRRFAFKEIKATDRIQMLDSMDNKDEIVKRMKSINEQIEKIEGLSSAYHIGPAYFLKLKNYNGDFDQLWKNHIEGLLFEYLRGMTDIQTKLKTLAEAYGYSKADEYVKTSNN